jgi:uncharacterized protein (TIGR02265 family)
MSAREPASWGGSPISPEQAADFAAQVTTLAGERLSIADDLLSFPPGIKVRGVFLEGLSRIVVKAKGRAALDAMLERGGLPAQATAFRLYPHRDFYKLYYLAARSLYPLLGLPVSLRRIAQTFFPTFRSSLFGKTMTALMGDDPKTILPLIARAYDICVDGTRHQAEPIGDAEMLWTCSVEAVTWYTETFTGILEGAIPPRSGRVGLDVLERSVDRGMARYRFRIRW